MFGANPIPQDEVGNSNLTSLSNSSTIMRTLATDEHRKNVTALELDTKTSNNSSEPIFRYLADSKSNGTGNSRENNVEDKSINIIETEFVCAFYNPDFIIYSSLCSFYIPCIFMVCLYSRIFWVSIKSCKLTVSLRT